MKLTNIINNLKYNIKVYGTPKLINYNNLSDNFIVNYDKDSIIENAISYFYEDPIKWELPAKNYFVRICLAYYLSKDLSVKELLNFNEILPYDDKYSLKYDQEPHLYDLILSNLSKVKFLPGYKKTIDIFGYLYNNPLHNHKITIGYNTTGQDFFDIIQFYKKYIEEYYFSFRHTMPKAPLDIDNIFNQLKWANQYGISSNLLLNTEQEEKEYKLLIDKAYNCTPLKAVTVLTLETAKKIKNEYPNLNIHVSTHGAQDIDVNKLSKDLIYCVNLNEPDIFTEQQQNIIKKCKETGIKLKHITNRGCIFGKHDFMSKLTNKDIMCCQGYQCKKILKEHPWVDLLRTNLYKEQLRYLNFDFIKLSTREKTNDEIKFMLKYWTDPKIFTTHVGNIPIFEKKYPIFLEWCKQRFNCKGNCITCNICREYYEKLTN